MYRKLTRSESRRDSRQDMIARRLKSVAAVAMALALAACAQNQLPKPGDSAANGFGPGYGQGAGAGGPVTPGTPREFQVRVGDKVYFTTDSVTLTADAQRTLRGQAQWLNRYPRFTITVEGHADERGTREYNLALGARRASAVRGYLASLGVNPARMRTVSYGKERPVAVCNDISCWSQNRRAQTRLNRRGTI